MGEEGGACFWRVGGTMGRGSRCTVLLPAPRCQRRGGWGFWSRCGKQRYTGIRAAANDDQRGGGASVSLEQTADKQLVVLLL